MDSFLGDSYKSPTHTSFPNSLNKRLTMLVVSSFEIKKTLKMKPYYKLVSCYQLQLPLCE